MGNYCIIALLHCTSSSNLLIPLLDSRLHHLNRFGMSSNAKSNAKHSEDRVAAVLVVARTLIITVGLSDRNIPNILVDAEKLLDSAANVLLMISMSSTSRTSAVVTNSSAAS